MRLLAEFDILAELDGDGTRAFGARGAPRLVAPPCQPADNDATCDDALASSQDAESWARHAHAANGFGDVAKAIRPNDPEAWHPSASGSRRRASADELGSDELGRAARYRRAFLLGEMIAAASRALVATVRTLYARHRRRRSASEMREVLRELDDRTLRDLGFHRSEIESVAAEAIGAAEPSRLRARLDRINER